MSDIIMILEGILLLVTMVALFAIPVLALVAIIVPQRFRFNKTRKQVCALLLGAWGLNILLIWGVTAFGQTDIGKSIHERQQQEQAERKEQEKQKEEGRKIDNEIREKEARLAQYEAEYKAKHIMTLDKYNRIEMGMTPKQVHEIVGSLGEVMSQSNVGGYETVILKFDGNGSLGSNANITIQNDWVVGKAQVGLK